jgi:hypothetical protein
MSLLDGMTLDQKRAVVLYHITPNVVYSTMMSSGSLQTLLAGQNIPVVTSSDGADVGTGICYLI